ncbi:hypothetical protein D3C81_1276170 [compost metagenome]
MRVGFHPRRYAQQNIHGDAFLSGKRLKHMQLRKIVSHETADAGGYRHFQFIRRLVVAMKMDSLRRESRLKGRKQFALGDNVQGQALLLGQPAHRHDAERFAGISNLESQARCSEGVHIFTASLPHKSFIYDIQRRSVGLL